MNTICIMCPMGCPLSIEEVNGEVVVTGNTCKRGQIYGVEEFTHPKRAVTTLVKTADGCVVSVKTSNTVPKEKIFDIVKAIGELTAPSDVQIGDVLACDLLELGVDIVVTGTAKSGVKV